MRVIKKFRNIFPVGYVGITAYFDQDSFEFACKSLIGQVFTINEKKYELKEIK